jgi:carnitine O-acetyltransferase
LGVLRDFTDWVFSIDGFFDAGMLLHALKGLNAERESRGEKPARRRFVGKKLHLNEY